MNDRLLVEAIRARDPGALAALHDLYAESLYGYCLTLLGCADSAQVALRDTLIAAEAHIHALADPARLRVWLCALAHHECLRRRLPRDADGDPRTPPMPDVDGMGDADLRVVAWHAVWSLPRTDRALLDLVTRHDMTLADAALVGGLPERQAAMLHDAARARLRDAVTVEILARKGPYDCADRARILTGFAGELTGAMRERLVRHLGDCATCAPHRARQVSAAKVFELLPRVTLPETLRLRTMSCFADPELVPYRRFVARRVGPLGPSGFPAGGVKSDRRWVPAAVVTAAALAAVTVAAVTIGHLRAGDGVPDIGIAAQPHTEASPAPAAPAGAGETPGAHPAAPGGTGGVPDPRDPAVPPAPIGWSPPVSPLDVGPGPSGTAAPPAPPYAPSPPPPLAPPSPRPPGHPSASPPGTPSAGPSQPHDTASPAGPSAAPPGRDHHHHPRPRRSPCPTPSMQPPPRPGPSTTSGTQGSVPPATGAPQPSADGGRPSAAAPESAVPSPADPGQPSASA
jgi:DNA-directed RNA polymerase specialized sigma24 family protein